MKVEAYRRLMRAQELAERGKKTTNSGEPEIAMAILADAILAIIQSIEIELGDQK